MKKHPFLTIVAALAAVLREPPFRARMAAAGYGVLGLTGPAALEHLRASNRTWRRMLGRNPPP